MEFIHQPAPSHRLGDYLKAKLSEPWTHFRAAVAFVKRSGTRHIAASVSAFAQTSHVEIVSGIDHRGTSAEGLRDLIDAVAPDGRVIVFHNRLPMTFHPKVYLFKSPTSAEVLIGSGNLTEGGLFTNYEASLRLILDLADPDQTAILQSIEHVLDVWADSSSGTAHMLDEDLLARLMALGLVPSEALAVSEPGDPTPPPTSAEEHLDSPFIARAEPHAPPFPKPTVSRGTSPTGAARPLPRSGTVPDPPVPEATGFVMTLQRTDVGVGQTTPGTSRRSPEIFIPLSARNAVPSFWDWPEGFTPDSRHPGKFDRFGVHMRLGGEIVTVNMMSMPSFMRHGTTSWGDRREA